MLRQQDGLDQGAEAILWWGHGTQGPRTPLVGFYMYAYDRIQVRKIKAMIELSLQSQVRTTVGRSRTRV